MSGNEPSNQSAQYPIMNNQNPFQQGSFPMNSGSFSQPQNYRILFITIDFNYF